VTDFLVFPDLESITSWAIRQANIPGLGARVYSSIPGKPVYPLVQYGRFGGTPAVAEALDRGRIQLSVFGGAPGDSAPILPNKGDIEDIAQLVRITMLRMAGVAFTAPPAPVAAYITAVRDVMGLTWSPDPSTSRDRYIFSMNVYGKPL